MIETWARQSVVSLQYFISSNVSVAWQPAIHPACHTSTQQLVARGWELTTNMLNYLIDYKKIYSHFELYLGFGLTQVVEIDSGTTIDVVCPIQPTPCLLMLWWLQESGHQQERYRSPKLEYSVSSIGRVNNPSAMRLQEISLATSNYPVIQNHWIPEKLEENVCVLLSSALCLLMF